MQLRADRMRFRPYGLQGGTEALGAINTLVQPNGEVAPLPSKVNRAMYEGELIGHVQPGGGGFGDPMTREPSRVAADVWNEKISAVYAREEHGVVVDQVTGELDVAGTADLRDSLRK